MIKNNVWLSAFGFLFGALMLASCSAIADSDEDVDALPAGTVELTVKTRTTDESEFQLSKELLRATGSPTEAKCQYVVVMVYDEANMGDKDYVPVIVERSLKENEDINSFSVELARGHSYRLCVLASECKPHPSDDGYVSLDSLRSGVYWASSQVVIPVDAPTQKTIQMTLARVVACVKIKAKDSYAKALTATLVHTRYSSTLNMLTGFGVPSAEPYVYVKENFAKYMSSGNSFVHYTLVSDQTPITYGGQECYDLGDISLTLKDGETTVGYMAYENIPANRNQQSVLSGLVFSLSNSVTLSINGDWGEDINVDF